MERTMRPLKLSRLVAFTVSLVIPILVGVTYVTVGRAAAPQTHMLTTHAGKLLLSNADGFAARQILAGSRPGQVTYPWYSWSPDGKYLLVVRTASPSGSWNLFL